MRRTAGHQKLVRHDDAPGEAHELTFSCYRRHQRLRLNSRCERLAEVIDRSMRTQHYELLAHDFMPEHAHLLVLPLAGATGIARLLFAIKRPFSFRVKNPMIADGDPLLSELMIRNRPGHASFRFWQEGPGYDRNIRTVATMRDVIEFIHRNPTRPGARGSPIEVEVVELACLRRGDVERHRCGPALARNRMFPLRPLHWRTSRPVARAAGATCRTPHFSIVGRLEGQICDAPESSPGVFF